MVFRRKSFEQPKLFLKDGRQAAFKFLGKFYHCGPWDGRSQLSAEVMQEYLRQVDDCRKLWAAYQSGVKLPEGDEDSLTVAEAVAMYLDFLVNDPEGYKPRRDGRTATPLIEARQAMRPFLALYASTPVGEITLHDLGKVRHAICHWDQQAGRVVYHTWWNETTRKPSEKCPPKEWVQETINYRMRHIVRMYQWLETEQGLVPDGTYAKLSTFKSKPAGRSVATKPKNRNKAADDRSVKITTKYCSPQVRVMIKLQRAKGMRPGEVCCMRPCDIKDRDKEVWVYRPIWDKTGHLIKCEDDRRTIYLNRRCQKLLQSWIDRAKAPDAFLFSAAESGRYMRRKAARSQKRKPRKTKIYPCEIKRRARLKAEREANNKSRWREYFTPSSYRQHIEYAIATARKAGHEVEDWHPYGLRHARAKEIRAKMHETAAAIEFVQAELGHKNIKTSEIYATNRNEKARQLALQEDHEAKARRAKKRGMKLVGKRKPA